MTSYITNKRVTIIFVLTYHKMYHSGRYVKKVINNLFSLYKYILSNTVSISDFTLINLLYLKRLTKVLVCTTKILQS